MSQINICINDCIVSLIIFLHFETRNWFGSLHVGTFLESLIPSWRIIEHRFAAASLTQTTWPCLYKDTCVIKLKVKVLEVPTTRYFKTTWKIRFGNPSWKTFKVALLLQKRSGSWWTLPYSTMSHTRRRIAFLSSITLVFTNITRLIACHTISHPRNSW